MARPVSIAPVNLTLIRYVIRQKDLSLTEIAKAMDVGLDNFSHMLAGRRPMTEERLAIVAEMLGKPVDYFRTPIGRLLINKAETDIVDFAMTEERGDPKKLEEYLDVSERLGHIDFQPELPAEDASIQQWDFWKKDAILPFRSDKAVAFWDFDGDEIIIRGPARCGKSTLILEYVIAKMMQNRGMQVAITRAFSVDLDAVRQNILDLMKYRFDDPLSSIRASGGKKFHTLEINGGELKLIGIDRAGGQLGAGYDLVVHSQAEQIKKENVDIINSRCSPAGNNWIEDGQPRSLVIYDVNPNRLDHYLEKMIRDGVKKIDFDFTDHPAYFDEDGNETELYNRVTSRLSRLEGVTRTRLFEGRAANPEGTIFQLEDCHILKALPKDFDRMHSFYRGFDFGMKDPSVCLWFGVHRHTNDVVVFREWRRVSTDTIRMGEEVKRYTDERVLMTVIDNDENLQSILQRECGIVTELAQKGPGSIASGITLAQHRLQNAREGKDGGLYFYNNPVVRDPKLIRDNEPLTTIDEAELYAWQENTDKPIDKHNHGWDIIRYVLDYLEHQQRAVGFGGTVAKRQTRL